MNCLDYALAFWNKHPEYIVYYNADHCVNLPRGTDVQGFCPLEFYGYNHMNNTFKDVLSEEGKELLKKYFKM